jgi:hypothetical protein
MHRPVAIFAAALITTMASCGGSPHETKQASLSHEALVVQVDASCARLITKAHRIRVPRRGAPLTTGLDDLASSLSEHVVEVERLRASAGDRTALNRYVDRARDVDLLAARFIQAQRQPIPGIESINRDAARPLQRWRSASRELGASRCLRAAGVARLRLKIYIS